MTRRELRRMRILAAIPLLFLLACAPVLAYPGGGYAQALGIPPGHLPPPGECRIWYPGSPPGQQPPPGHCDNLAGQVPPGAWLVHRPRKDRQLARVSVYHAQRRGSVVTIRLYDAESGEFLREERL